MVILYSECDHSYLKTLQVCFCCLWFLLDLAHSAFFPLLCLVIFIYLFIYFTVSYLPGKWCWKFLEVEDEDVFLQRMCVFFSARHLEVLPVLSHLKLNTSLGQFWTTQGNVNLGCISAQGRVSSYSSGKSLPMSLALRQLSLNSPSGESGKDLFQVQPPINSVPFGVTAF